MFLFAHCSPVDRLIQWTKTKRRSFRNEFYSFDKGRHIIPLHRETASLKSQKRFAYLESAVTPSAKNEADEQYDDFDLELHMPMRSFAPRRNDKSAFGDP